MNTDLILKIAEGAVAIALPLLIFLVPYGVKFLRANVSASDHAKLVLIVKGAVLIVGEVAKRTPTSLDDALVNVLKIVESELGKPLSPSEIHKVKNIALALHSDERFPARIADSSADLLRAALSSPAALKKE